MTRYDFEELRQKALDTESREDLEALADWLRTYDPQAWNGEVWDLGHGHELRPIYSQGPNENDGYDVIGYTIW